MKFNYVMKRKDLKKMFIKNYFKYNIFYIILASIIYFIMVREVMVTNIAFTLVFYLILLVLILIILYLFDLLYVNILIKINDKKTNYNYGNFEVSIDNDGICSKGKNTTTINWKDITDIKYIKNRIYIKYNNKDKLVFLINKDFLEKKELFESIKEEINIHK